MTLPICLDPTTGAPYFRGNDNDEGNDTHDLAASPNGEYIYVQPDNRGQLEQFAINPITGAVNLLDRFLSLVNLEI